MRLTTARPNYGSSLRATSRRAREAHASFERRTASWWSKFRKPPPSPRRFRAPGRFWTEDDRDLLAKLRYVDSGRADAGRLPVNERGDLVAGPEEVAGPDVAMDEDGFAGR